MTELIEITGSEGGKPVNHHVGWMYPVDGSALAIKVFHVRAIDWMRLRFDFDAHEWVAEQELQAPTDHEPATGIWREVARWSGNALLAEWERREKS